MWEQGEVDITIVPTEMTDQYTENTEFYYTGADDYIMLNMSEDRPLANKNLSICFELCNQQNRIQQAG